MINKKLSALLLSIGLSCSASATPIVEFFVEGNTFFNPFSLSNNSDAGEKITGISLDISGLGIAFDTVSGGLVNDSDGKQFTPVAGSDVTTGVIGPVNVADGATLLDISFSDFDPGEMLVWDIDLDFLPAPTRVDGDDLIGAFLSVTFDSGELLSGFLNAVDGNADASEFVATGITRTIPEPGSWLLLLAGLGMLSRYRKVV